MVTQIRNEHEIGKIEYVEISTLACLDCRSGCRHSNPCPSVYGVTYTVRKDQES